MTNKYLKISVTWITTQFENFSTLKLNSFRNLTVSNAILPPTKVEKTWTDILKITVNLYVTNAIIPLAVLKTIENMKNTIVLEDEGDGKMEEAH